MLRIGWTFPPNQAPPTQFSFHAWGFWSNFFYSRMPFLTPTFLFFPGLGLAQWCAGLHTTEVESLSKTVNLFRIGWKIIQKSRFEHDPKFYHKEGYHLVIKQGEPMPRISEAVLEEWTVLLRVAWVNGNKQLSIINIRRLWYIVYTYKLVLKTSQFLK